MSYYLLSCPFNIKDFEESSSPALPDIDSSFLEQWLDSVCENNVSLDSGTSLVKVTSQNNENDAAYQITGDDVTTPFSYCADTDSVHLIF